MFELLPDVLDHLGKVPRELGAVHLHVEPVAADIEGRALATIWLQAAFDGPIHGRLIIAADGAEVATAALPALPDGAAIKWSLPFAIPGSADRLLFLVDAPAARSARRIRPAWKLSDTLEMPAGAASEDFTGDAAMMGVALVTGVAVASMSVGRVHAAHALPPGFPAEVVRTGPPVIARESLEVVWSPGQPLPAAELAAPAWRPVEPARPSSLRLCPACGERVDEDRASRDRACPSCGAPWAY